jgi:hypothetical protein
MKYTYLFIALGCLSAHINTNISSITLQQPLLHPILPEGSYKETCKNCRIVEDSKVNCKCPRRNGSYKDTTIDVSNRGDDINLKNDGGDLRFE